MSVKSKTIPFSLEVWHKYKGISEVITRGGSKVGQLTLFQAGSNQAYPLVGVAEDVIEAWTKDGEYWEQEVSPKDLMLKVHTVMPFSWQIYSSFEDMLEVVDSDGNKVIKVEIDDPLSSYPLRTERGWYEINGKCCVDYLPNLETMILKQDIHTSDNLPKFKVGDKVKMISNRPTHGFGGVKVGDVGVLTEVHNNYCLVKFPNQETWTADYQDIKLDPDEVFENKHIIHYRKQSDNGICPLNGITFVGVEEEDKMLIYASVCSGDNFSKAKGVEIALSRKPLGYTVVKDKEALFDWIELRSATLANQTTKYPNYYNTLRKEVLDMIKKV